MTHRKLALGICGLWTLTTSAWVTAQPRPERQGPPGDAPPATQPANGRRDGGGREGFGPGGFGPGGGPGGPMGQDRALVAEFDKDKDGRLNADERAAARVAARAGGRGGRGPGGPGGFGPGGGGPGGGGLGGRGNREPARPGPKVAKTDVRAYPDLPFYDTSIVRTIFLDFPNDDWETELADFIRTDVEVPATLTVDGRSYPAVGVSFRGMSSLMMVPAGYKRSFNISIDHADAKQRVAGYKTLNLLNCNDDPSFLHTVLFSQIARQYIPTPKANFVKVVINGESWGIYANAQQFNKEFVDDFFPSKKSTGTGTSAPVSSKDSKSDQDRKTAPKPTRWKVGGSPGGGGSLAYLGDDPTPYKRLYEIRSDDTPESWKALIDLCRTLNQTPPDKLQEALEPMMDIDAVLWFLALDNVMVNADGYWTRGSDYNLLRTREGKFQIVPHDMNETFSGGGGPGGPGGRGRPDADAPAGPGGDPNGRPGEFRPATRPAGDLVPGDPRGPGPDGPPEGFRPGRFGPGGFGPGGGMGPGGMGPGGPGGGGVNLDPLVGLSDHSKPLRSRLLAVPALRARYLAKVRTIADKSLDWKTLGPVVAKYRDLLDQEVAADTRKLSTYEAFQQAVGEAPANQGNPAAGGRGPGRGLSLRQFADQRRAYLLGHAEVKAAKQP